MEGSVGDLPAFRKHSPFGAQPFLPSGVAEAECEVSSGVAPQAESQAGGAGSGRPLGPAWALPSLEGGGGGFGTRQPAGAEEELAEGGGKAQGRRVRSREGGGEGGTARKAEERNLPLGPLTCGALGLDGLPPQGPLAQHHIAAVPTDLEDAPEQNLLRRCLWLLPGRPQHRGHGVGRGGRLFLPAALQGAHPAAALPPGHGGASG